METVQPCLEIKNDGRKRIKCGDGDGISALSDDVLLDILQCLDLRTAVRAGAVARRWRRLPCMLPVLDLDIATLVPHCGKSLSRDSVMAMYTNVAMWFLLPTHHHRTNLRLTFYLVDLDPCLRSIGAAIAATSADRVELTLRNEYNNFIRCGQCFPSFLEACPTTFARLTSIALHDFFTIDSEIADLLDACHLLKFLSLTNCNLGLLVMRIDAPRISLLALELHNCFFLAVELVSVPKLERFVCDAVAAMFVNRISFGSVPCLHTMKVSARYLQRHFQNLPSRSLAFHSLIHVYLCKLDITDIALMLSLLQATPFLENLYIKASHHSIINRGSDKLTTTGERPKFEHRNLSLLEISSHGISKDMDMMNYISLIRNHAVCLKRINLLEQCEYTAGCHGVTCSCQVKEEQKKIVCALLNMGCSTSLEITIEPVVSKRKTM